VAETANFAAVQLSRLADLWPLFQGGQIMVFVLVLEKGNVEVRIPNVASATEESDSVVAYDANHGVKGRFKLDDVRSWHIDMNAS
jgi:hypothetical protein